MGTVIRVQAHGIGFTILTGTMTHNIYGCRRVRKFEVGSREGWVREYDRDNVEQKKRILEEGKINPKELMQKKWGKSVRCRDVTFHWEKTKNICR